MKKVAICISGQYRTFEDVWASNLEILKKNKEYEYHFFCFFWKTKGDTKRILPGQNRKFSNLFLDPFYYFPLENNQKISTRKIKNIISNANIKISSISERNLMYKENFSKILNAYPHNKNDAFNSFCLWKAIQICNQMCVDYQIKNKIVFDCVMRIRPDWKLKKNPISQFFKKKKKNSIF